MARPLETADGRRLIVPSRFGPGIDPYICGAGDDRATGIKADGPTFSFNGLGSGEETIEFGFVDTVRVAAGGVMWKDCVPGDVIDMWMSSKAAPLTSTPGAGNANKVDLGGYNLIVPAAGDGEWTVDLATCDLVPVLDKDNPDGYWDWDALELGMGTVTPGAGASLWNLFDIDIKLVHWVCKVPLLGDGENYIDPNSIDRKIYQRWTWYTKATSSSNNASAKIGFYLNLAREKTT